jgi:hypothetical protein
MINALPDQKRGADSFGAAFLHFSSLAASLTLNKR